MNELPLNPSTLAHATPAQPVDRPPVTARGASRPDTAIPRRAWLREPLLHFLLVGGLVFAADQAWQHWRGDGKTIEVPASAYEEARALVGSNLQRAPTAKDLKVLIDRWVDNEVLYREGLALGLDKGDSAIRDRVIFKALSVAQSGLALPAYDTAVLRAWFEAHRARYDTPARYDFLEAVVTGDRGEARLRAFVDSLNGRGSASDVDSSLTVFKDRPRGNLEQAYGVAFADALTQARPGGDWLLLNSQAGWRVVRLQTLKPAVAARYDDLADQVLRDWKDDTMAQMTTQAVRDMGRKYRVLRQESAQ